MVADKKSRFNVLTKLYLWLNHTFVEGIMLKNNLKQLNELMKEHAAGSTDVPTELDIMLKEEALDIVKEKFDNIEGSV